MAKKKDKDVIKLEAQVASLRQKNADLASTLTDAKVLLEQGGAIVESLQAEVAAAKEALASATTEHAAQLFLAEQKAQQALDASDEAHEREQGWKIRLQAAERKVARISKAWAVLRDSKHQKKDVEEFLTVAAMVFEEGLSLPAGE